MSPAGRCADGRTTTVLVGSLGLATLLVAQGWRTARGEYLAAPEYTVDLVVDPAGEVAAGSSARSPLRLAVLGDSTVEGIGAPTPQRSLPAQVADRVAARLSRPVAVAGLGVSGSRTADVAWAQVPRLAGREIDAVLVVVGSNDATHGLPPWLMAGQTRAMLAAVAAASGAPVVLGGIPEFHTVPAVPRPLRWVLGTHADLLRRRQRAAAQRVGVPFVDIRALASPRFLGCPETMSVDEFHPSDLGYAYWADVLAPVLVAALATRRPPG